MKKLLIISVMALCAMTMSAQTYEVYARSNDTIKLYANALGAAAKALIPGAAPVVPSYRMIKKTENGKESILFLDFVNIADKFIVSYETDMVTPGKFITKTHSVIDLYKGLTRVNAIYLEGEYMSMKVEAYQRPLPYKDIFIIDGIQLQLPVKLVEVENKLVEAAAKEVNQLVITEEELLELAKDPANIAYVALEMKSQTFNRDYSDECKRIFNAEVIRQYLSKDEAELSRLSQSHHKYFNKYHMR